MSSTFRVLQSAEAGAFYWELRAADGDVLATSGETYVDFGDCLAGLYVFRGRAAESPTNDRTVRGAPARLADTEFEVYRDEDGGFDWNFQQTTGEPLASGSAHPDKTVVLDRLRLAKEAAPTAEVVVEADEPVDVEACAGRGHEAPGARRYRIRVDREKYVVDRPRPTGREVLEMAGRQPAAQFQLYQKLRGGEKRAIALDETTDLTAPGVERFQTIELAVTDGGTPNGCDGQAGAEGGDE